MTKYNKSFVVVEGLLDLEMTPIERPAECTNDCYSIYAPILMGVARRKGGLSSVGVVNDALWHLNGKKVRVTIEIED